MASYAHGRQFLGFPVHCLLLTHLCVQELRKQTEDPQLQADITQAIDTIQDVLDQANEAIHKEHLAAAVVDLSERVDDWKSLKMDTFGELLRFGTFAVVKGDTGKDNEREVCDHTIPYTCDLHPFIADIPLSTIFSSLSVSFFAARILTPTNRRPSL